jgi:hypothetical protein
MGWAEAGDHDKARAFVGVSLKEFLEGGEPGVGNRLTRLTEAVRLQSDVGAIQAGPRGRELEAGPLKLVEGTSQARLDYLTGVRKAGEAERMLSFSVPLETASPANVLARLDWFKHRRIPAPAPDPVAGSGQLLARVLAVPSLYPTKADIPSASP